MGKRILVCITGASGVRYGISLLKVLKRTDASVDLVVSGPGIQVLEYELSLSPEDLELLASNVYDNNDLFSPPASGSVSYDAMVVVPCSMNTAGKMDAGIADNLILRAANVMLKEKRTLVIVPRETPLSTINLRVLYSLSRVGTMVVPASPGFYHAPESFKDLDNFISHKILGLLGIPSTLVKPFSGR